MPIVARVVSADGCPGVQDGRDAADQRENTGVIAGTAPATPAVMADYDPRSRLPSLLDPACADTHTDSAADTLADSAGGIPGHADPSAPSRAAPSSVDLARRRLATKRAYRVNLRTLTRWAKAFELTPARFEMLAAIASHPLGTTQRTLSHSLSISQGTTSRMVARLVTLRLVEVTPNPHDARKRLLVLTDEGQRRLSAAQSAFFDGGFAPPDPDVLN